MTRKILEQYENYNVTVDTFWNGKEESVQITDVNTSKWIQLTRVEFIEAFSKTLTRLREQVKEDEKHPPFWQELNKEV